MSSYIVSDKIINQIITFIGGPVTSEFTAIHFHGFKKTTLYKSETPIGEGEYHEETCTEYNNRIGHSLMELNDKAVNYRYSENNKSIYGGFKRESANNHQVLKSLRYFLYQCNEGNTPENQIFKDLEILKDEIQEVIINTSPEMEAAIWGG